jgi:hypothetical protein
MPGRGQVAQQQPTIADFLRAASSGGA